MIESVQRFVLVVIYSFKIIEVFVFADSGLIRVDKIFYNEEIVKDLDIC